MGRMGCVGTYMVMSEEAEEGCSVAMIVMREVVEMRRGDLSTGEPE